MDDRVIKILSKMIIYTVKHLLANASFDVTKQGIIKEVLNDNNYVVSIKGSDYNIKSKLSLNVNDVVYVMFPENNPSNMFILPS